MNSCYKCKHFNGEQGDGKQFCDRKEDYVSEHCWCPDFVEKFAVRIDAEWRSNPCPTTTHKK